MSRMGKLTAGVVTMGVLVGVAVPLAIISRGVSARDEPTAVEAFMARRLRRLATPSHLHSAKNPVALTSEVMAGAREHFADHCASCHGNDGKGQTSIGRNLYPKAPDMTLAATQDLVDGELFGIIENGIRLTGMPAWGNGTPESEKASWELVHLVRHFPRITQAELAEMASLNPMSRGEFEEEESMKAFLKGESVKPPQHVKH